MTNPDNESMASITMRIIAEHKAKLRERFARETQEWTEMLARDGIVFTDKPDKDADR